VAPSALTRGSPTLLSVSQRWHRGKRLNRVHLKIGGYFLFTSGGVSDAHRQKGTSGGDAASAACLGPPSRYARGADEPFQPGTAPDRVGSADISALSLESVCHRSLVMEDHREVSTLSGGVLWQPLSNPLQAGLRFLPDPLPAALSGPLAIPLAVRRQQGNGLTTFRRCNRHGEVGGVSPPVARRPRVRSSEPHNLATYRFGPSLSASLACSWMTAFIDTSQYVHRVPAPGPRLR
jgi:hypothetical protein